MITLYTTHCPKCMVLENKLKEKNIEYEAITDVSIMQNKGFLSAPTLEVDGEILDFMQAIKWVSNK